MKKVVLALGALALLKSLLVSCSGPSNGNVPGNPVEISEENVSGIWQQYSASVDGESYVYPEMYRQYFEFRADGRLLVYDNDGEFRDFNNWSVSEGVISIVDATDITDPIWVNRKIDEQDWRIIQLTDKALKIQVMGDGSIEDREDIYMVFHRPTSLPNFYGKPTDL